MSESVIKSIADFLGVKIVRPASVSAGVRCCSYATYVGMNYKKSTLYVSKMVDKPEFSFLWVTAIAPLARYALYGARYFPVPSDVSAGSSYAPLDFDALMPGEKSSPDVTDVIVLSCALARHFGISVEPASGLPDSWVSGAVERGVIKPDGSLMSVRPFSAV